MKVSFSDTHCHLDLLSNPKAQIKRAKERGVDIIIIPAVEPKNFHVVKKFASNFKGIFYSVGIHPCKINQVSDEDLSILESFLIQNINDPNLIAVGEIGLDFFLQDLNYKKMEKFYCHQLLLAKKFSLPVLLHVRRAQDLILKHFKKSGVISGIAHSFNGSNIQANRYIQNNLLLGFGGAMTYKRSLQIRRLASSVPDHAFVLETDSPDLSPAWKKPNEEKKAWALIEQGYPGYANTLRALPRLLQPY